MLSRTQKSMAVREHNRGKSLAQVALFIGNGVRAADLETYLKDRKGYPGKIELRRPEFSLGHKPHQIGGEKTGRKPKPQGGDNRPYIARNKSVSLVKMPWENGDAAN